MMRFAKLSLVLLVLAGTLWAQQGGYPVDTSNHPWAKWEAGSYVKMRSINDMGAMGRQEVEQTVTLISVTDTHYKFKRESNIAGQIQEQVQTEELGMGWVIADPNREKLGTESVCVEGTDYECTIWKSTMEQGGAPVDTKTWFCEELGLPLKIEMKMGGPMATDTTIVAVSLSEDVAVGDKTLNCYRLEGTMTSPMGKGTMTMWQSLDIPGGTVKAVTEMAMGPNQITSTTEAIEFEGK